MLYRKLLNKLILFLFLGVYSFPFFINSQESTNSSRDSMQYDRFRNDNLKPRNPNPPYGD